MQEVRLRQARRYRKALRAMQGKPEAILERRQEGRRSSRWRVTGGDCRRKDEEEVTREKSTSRWLFKRFAIIPLKKFITQQSPFLHSVRFLDFEYYNSF